MSFDLRLFGRAELRDPHGQLLNPASRKDLALLAYLAVQSRPCARGQLAALFWPDRPEAQARKSLRQSLVVLRRLFGEAEVVLSGTSGELSLDGNLLNIDFARFFGRAMTGERGAAITEFRGRLLEGFEDISPPFDDWLTLERTRTEDLAANLLAERCRAFLERAEWQEAEETARRLVEVAPFKEEGRRLLMRALRGGGERAQALQEFHVFSGLLREELDVAPDPETLALYRSIQNAPAIPVSPAETQTPDNGLIPRPGVAVLPFRADAEGVLRVSLSCGLPEELISTLAAYRWFYVISYLQASIYGDGPVPPQRLKSELGVDYVVAGRAEHRGAKLRLRLELLSSITGEHLWSESFEAFADELLIAQDELARKVAAQLEPELIKAEADQRFRAPETNFDAWANLMRARQMADRCEPQSVRSAVEIAQDVVRNTPESALAHGTLAYSVWLDHVFSHQRALPLEEGMRAAENAIAIDPRYYLGHSALGTLNNQLRVYDVAARNLRRAIDANPSFPVSYNQLTSALCLDGRPAEALEWVGRLQEISPNDPLKGFYACVRSVAHYLLGDYEASIENGLISLGDHPGWAMSDLITAAAMQRAGRAEEARKVSARIHESHGPRTRAQVHDIFKPRRDIDFQAIVEPLLDLGLAR